MQRIQDQVIESKHCMKYTAKNNVIKDDKRRFCSLNTETAQYNKIECPLMAQNVK